MLSDTDLEGRFIKAQNILDYVSRPLSLLGMWPVNVTMGSRIRMIMYFIYHFYRIGMELIEFAMVFGNLERVVENLMMTALQIAIIVRLALPRFAGSMRRVLETLEDLHQRNKFKDTGEMEIFIEYSERSERCFKVLLWCAAVACTSWYLTPIQNYLLARVRNETFIYEAPWRMPEFVATERAEVALIVHIMEIPVVYICYCYMISYSVYLTLINHIRCQLVIVSYEVRNFKVDRMGHTKEVLSPIVERHITALHVAKSLSDCTHISLLAELFAVSVTLALLMYNAMVASESASSQNRIKMVNSGMYIVNMLLIIFANCYMGQNLEDEGVNLSDAFYNNNWTNLPVSVQKSFLICIIHSQRRLQLTAGKFYKFSLNSFTRTMKSIIAFYSMLRATT
ncbi:odorant receptor 94a-like [Diachasmimorpha longicaudata]|uniref:odorant receptor 94a-like n=1 Tax=Diachasmimorpha longicaudata TaxID=58733 RepID=UPI0030B8FEDA